MSGRMRVPAPRNEAVMNYAPGSPERRSLEAWLGRASDQVVEVPLYIDGKAIQHQPVALTSPHAHGRRVAKVHSATPEHVDAAIRAAEAARPAWSELDYVDRAAVFLKAADLISGPYRDAINGATILGQSKTAHQAEIDAVCELADFWRYNAYFGETLAEDQPMSPPGMWNRQELRPLDGFVFAVTPFNFTAIAGNLPTAPALMGNTVVWKPAPTQMLSAQVIVEVLEKSGLPPGVINLVAGDPEPIGRTVLASPHLAGLHFTGSTRTFQTLWRGIGENIQHYRQYPRIVGETGGKDFIFVHPSWTSGPEALVTAIIRGAFEFQGQKCSAASRVYLPRSLYTQLKEPLLAAVSEIKVGDPSDFSNFMGAVIDARSFEKICGYLEFAKSDPQHRVVAGGEADRTVGYFVQPTVVEAVDPRGKLMTEEIFGPVVTIFVYDDARVEEAVTLCEGSTEYALTGAVFAEDRRVVADLSRRLRYAAGNFYINDKPTGSVVGQQPFGGSRASGTNDKAGSAANLMRWVSPRAIKETFVSPTDWRYPYMQTP